MIINADWWCTECPETGTVPADASAKAHEIFQACIDHHKTLSPDCQGKLRARTSSDLTTAWRQAGVAHATPK